MAISLAFVNGFQQTRCQNKQCLRKTALSHNLPRFTLKQVCFCEQQNRIVSHLVDYINHEDINVVAIRKGQQSMLLK